MLMLVMSEFLPGVAYLSVNRAAAVRELLKLHR